MVERAVYRWDFPERPIDAIEFDPFDSPWRPDATDTNGAAEATSAPAIVGSHAPPHERPANDDAALEQVSDFRASVDAHEKAILARALASHRHNQRRTAQALGLTYDQLRHCLRKHALLERTG